MKKYRARWNGNSEHNKIPCWLTGDCHVDTRSKNAFVGSQTAVINEIARMSRNQPATVTNGRWMLEQKRKGWFAPCDGERET